jgi:hypothetical protein
VTSEISSSPKAIAGAAAPCNGIPSTGPPVVAAKVIPAALNADTDKALFNRFLLETGFACDIK